MDPIKEPRKNTPPENPHGDNNMQFRSFSHLPPEIRLMVWQLALCTPNIVQLCFDSLDHGNGFEMYLKHRVIPPLLHVCRESRRCARQIYPDKFFEQEETAIMTYINYEVDTVYLGTANYLMHIDWIIEALSLKDVRSLDLDRVRHLAVAANFWNLWDPEHILSMVSCFQNLQTLTLCIEDHAESDEPARFVELGTTSTSDTLTLWGYQGGPEGFPSACADILQKIREIYEEDEDIRAEWKRLPELKFMKLTGEIYAKKTSVTPPEDEEQPRSEPLRTVHHGAILRVGY